MAEAFVLDDEYVARKRSAIQYDFALARYRNRETWIDAPIQSIRVLEDGTAEVTFAINRTSPVDMRPVCEIELLDRGGRRIGSQAVSIFVNDGVLYSCRVLLFQVFENKDGKGAYDRGGNQYGT